jgi:hypothetical protein
VPLSHYIRQSVLCMLRSNARPYVDTADQLAGAAVDIDARLGHTRPPVCVQLLFIAVYGWQNQNDPPCVMRWRAAYLPTAPLYGAPATL